MPAGAGGRIRGGGVIARIIFGERCLVRWGSAAIWRSQTTPQSPRILFDRRAYTSSAPSQIPKPSPIQIHPYRPPPRRPSPISARVTAISTATPILRPSSSSSSFSSSSSSSSSSPFYPLLLPLPSRRTLHTTHPLTHGHIHPPKPGEELHVTFVDKDGTTKHTYKVSEGDNLLDIAQANDLDMEGACGGSAACSTCHVIVTSQEVYDRIPEPDDDENDMLDLAFGLTETSRLGCQVKMTKEIDGLEIKLPSMTRNLQSSDFSKK